MDKKTQQEVVATLMKAGRRDLARQFVGARANKAELVNDLKVAADSFGKAFRTIKSIKHGTPVDVKKMQKVLMQMMEMERAIKEFSW